MKAPTKAQLARAVRKERIVAAAREIAEGEGWPAVTVRRLAEAIGFSQPVLYGHFPDGRDGIVRAVALDGFGRIAGVLRGDLAPQSAFHQPPPMSDGDPRPATGAVGTRGDWWWSTQTPPSGDAAESGGRARLRGLAERYLAFAQANPAVYEAMFSLPTDLVFASAATPEELQGAFAELASVTGGDEMRAEMLWSALHGLADLGRHGRVRPDREHERIDLLVDLFAPE